MNQMVAGRGSQRRNLSESQIKEISDFSELSDCHACKRPTGISTRRDSLRILESQWRIVLLCNQCHRRVESAQLCSYCLTEVTPPLKDGNEEKRGSLRKCTRCNRLIHEECISGYSNLAPFSFLPGAGDLGSEEFAICIDCWLPKLLENRHGGGSGRRALNRVPVEVNLCNNPLGVSCGSGCAEKKPPPSKSPEDAANEASFVARKKRFDANKARRMANRKDKAARSAVKLAMCAIDLIAEKRLVNEKDGSGSSNGCDEASSIKHNVEQLKYELHRMVSKSPRIAKSLHLSDGECKESFLVSKVRYHSLPETTVPAQSKLHTNSMDSKVTPPEGRSSKLVYVEPGNCENRNAGHQLYLKKCENDHQLMQTGTCVSEPDRLTNSIGRTISAIAPEHDHQSMQQNERCVSEPDPDPYMRKYTRRNSTNIQLVQNGRYGFQSDRYRRTYIRRNRLKHGHHQLMQNGSSSCGSQSDRYMRKYSRRSSANLLEHEHQMTQNGWCGSPSDRYMRKYSRRASANTLEHDRQVMQNGSFGSESDPYSRKYTSRRFAILPETTTT